VQGLQVLIRTVPLQVGVMTYHTSGAFTEEPQGVMTSEPGSDGVAQIFEPHIGGALMNSGNAFWHRSFGGGGRMIETVWLHVAELLQQS
jgi:hypothetical protein